MNMKMQMQKKFFAGIFVGALFSAAIFAGEARAQGVPSNLLLTPEPGSESTALRLTWTQPSGEIQRQILDVRQSGGTWGNDVFFSTLPSGVVASNTLGSGNFLYIDPAVSQTTLSNLSPDTTYEARVRVRNSSGTGAWSGAVRRATLAAGTVAGTPPGNLSYEQVSGSESYQIRLSWTAGTAPSGATAQHQSIAIRRPGGAWPNPSAKDNQLPHGASWTGRTTAGDEHQIHPAATGGNIINLRAATTFELRVRLWYQVAGQPEAAGAWSDVLQVETGEAVFGVTPPTGLTFTPTPGEEGFSGRLHWTNGRAIASRHNDRYIQLHTISMRVSGGDWPGDSLFSTLAPGVKMDAETTGTPGEIDPDATTALLTRLEPDTTYEVRMRSLDGGSETGDWSQVLRFTTAQGAKGITPPSGLRVAPTRGAEASSVSLNWTRGSGPIAFQTMSVRALGEEWQAVRSHNALPTITDSQGSHEMPLDAHEGPDDDDNHRTKTIHRLESSARLRRMEPATTYQVRMNSVSEREVSDWSAVVQFATASGTRLPDTDGGVVPPYNLVYTPTRGAESTSGRLHWTLGAPIGYRLRDDRIQWNSLNLRDIDTEWEEHVGFVIVPDGVTWDARRGEDHREINSEETSVLFTGLEPATTYQVRMVSYDDGSTAGPWSEALQFVTESMDNILAVLTPRV
ncbi:MAG: fibronectin type III domain-containing protein, partial [Gammaproteobacteria bacterium]|nr:fibronectin type III domain-containing protein [Gammaproteobacteria bacterium]